MSKANGRVGDIGVGFCSAHPSTLSIVTVMITGAQSVGANGRPVTTKLSLGLSSCGHTSIVATTSTTSQAEGQGIHRVGDVGLLPGGSYILTTGSPDSTAGD
jgi:hypothetical protein